MFGVDAKQITYTYQLIRWMVKAIQQLAVKAGVELDPVPTEPGE